MNDFPDFSDDDSYPDIAGRIMPDNSPAKHQHDREAVAIGQTFLHIGRALTSTSQDAEGLQAAVAQATEAINRLNVIIGPQHKKPIRRAY
jgi:hypothetical protein